MIKILKNYSIKENSNKLNKKEKYNMQEKENKKEKEQIYIANIEVTKTKIRFLCAITIFVIVVCVLTCFCKKHEDFILRLNDEDMNSVKGKVRVYLTGAVKNNGVYSFDTGITLRKAIDLTGGVIDEADISDIDLDIILKDLEKIYIPYVQDEYFFKDEEENKSDKININTAVEDELMLLEGIGEGTARKIVSYREKNRFQSIEEIMNVPRNW